MFRGEKRLSTHSLSLLTMSEFDDVDDGGIPSDGENSPSGGRTVRIAGLPKGAILWPTGLISVILSVVHFFLDNSTVVGYIFMAVFTINLLILFFEFGRGTVVAVAGLLVAAFFVGIYLVQWVDFNFRFLDWNLYASTAFYFIFGLTLLFFIFVGTFITRRFHYYILGNNELVVKTGILGNAVRLASPSLEIRKDKPDIFESLLLRGSGRLTLIPESRTQVIVIENVPRIDHIENEIRRILGVLNVE